MKKLFVSLCALVALLAVAPPAFSGPSSGSGYQQICDQPGDNCAAIKGASTVPAASDKAAVMTLSPNMATGATALGKAEDAGHTTGDTGVSTLCVRKDTNAQTTNADTDYAAPACDAYSTPYMRQDHPNAIRCTVTVSTATTIQAVGGSCAAPGAGLSLYLTDILFGASAAGIGADAFPTLKYGTGGTCGTGTTVFWGALTAAAIVATDNRSIPIKIPANNEVCWISSTAGSKFLVLGGFIAP